MRLPLAGPRPSVVRIDLGLVRPKVTSYRFAPPVQAAAPPPAPRVARPEPPAEKPAVASPAERRTRIAPPRDIVKLSEKFFYLLQPDL